jgi:hypothetical protein
MAEDSLGFALYPTVAEDSLDFPSILDKALWVFSECDRN